jgi:hypothetical protein
MLISHSLQCFFALVQSASNLSFAAFVQDVLRLGFLGFRFPENSGNKCPFHCLGIVCMQSMQRSQVKLNKG